MKRNHYYPFDLKDVATIIHQSLEALKFLHGIKLIHTDLKPENILLVSSEYERIPVKGKYSDEVRCSDEG